MAQISVIIPTKIIDHYTARCVEHLRKLKEEIEIIVVPDVICSGLPANKRNYAMKQATGEIFAFIDSDAYPHPDWLKNALYWLQCFPAVCGPGILPEDAPRSEQVAEQVHKWVFCSYRVAPQASRIVPWHPTFNLIVKREVATTFEDYLTGEDDKFCLNIKGGIFYHPDILVYHNRRPAFRPLWKQFGTFGRHKGHFLRLAVIAWVTTLWVYFINYIKGFFSRKL